jgi:hypothetical protein
MSWLPIVQPDGSIVRVPYSALRWYNLIDFGGHVDEEIVRLVTEDETRRRPRPVRVC